MKRIFTGLLSVALAVFMTGCSYISPAHYHIVCQDAGTTTETVGGNTAGQQILTAGLAAAGAAAKGGTLMASAPGANTNPATAQSKSFIDYYSLAAFGPDYASCTTSPPPAPASTSVVMMQPNGEAPIVTNVQGGQVVVMPPPTQPMSQPQPFTLKR